MISRASAVMWPHFTAFWLDAKLSATSCQPSLRPAASLATNQMKVVSQPKMEGKGRRKLVSTTKAIGDLKIHIRLWGVSRKKVDPSSESSYMTTQTRFARFRGHIRTFTLGIYFFSTHSPEFNNIYYKCLKFFKILILIGNLNCSHNNQLCVHVRVNIKQWQRLNGCEYNR